MRVAGFIQVLTVQRANDTWRRRSYDDSPLFSRLCAFATVGTDFVSTTVTPDAGDGDHRVLTAIRTPAYGCAVVAVRSDDPAADPAALAPRWPFQAQPPVRNRREACRAAAAWGGKRPVLSRNSAERPGRGADDHPQIGLAHDRHDPAADSPRGALGLGESASA